MPKASSGSKPGCYDVACLVVFQGLLKPVEEYTGPMQLGNRGVAGLVYNDAVRIAEGVLHADNLVLCDCKYFIHMGLPYT